MAENKIKNISHKRYLIEDLEIQYTQNQLKNKQIFDNFFNNFNKQIKAYFN